MADSSHTKGAHGSERERLAAEQHAADRAYNEKLTAVDASIRDAPSVPAGPTPLDEQELPALADLASKTPASAEEQQAFNAAVVRHMTRMANAQRETTDVVRTTGTVVRDELEALATFESRLAQYLQQITPFIDTRMRAVGLAVEELRMAASAAQRAVAAIDRRVSGPVTDARGPAPAQPTSADAYKYVGFEDCFRGSLEEIAGRLTVYADQFAGASDVLDVGCGRGEFLELLKARGVSGRGVDANPEMAAICRARGLNVENADALAYLRGLPEESLGGLLAAQVVEHLEPSYLVQFLSAAHRALRPNARIVLETINPACWVAFFESYIRDITHVRPLHPDTLKYLVVATGFNDVDVQFKSPIEESGKLEPVHPPEAVRGATSAQPALAEIVRAFNANVQRLNERLFTYLDYSIVGSK